MAGRATRLSLWLVLAVALAHGLALQGVAQHLRPISALKPMAEPMFTRVLQPQAPVTVQRAAVSTAKPKVRKTRKAHAKSRPVPAPEPASTSPLPEHEQRPTSGTAEEVATPGQVMAPAPMDAASAAAAATPAADMPAADALVPSSAEAQPARDAAPSPLPANPTTAALDAWPSDTRLRYRLGGQFRGGELYGKAHVQWQRDGSTYQTQVDIDVTLLLHLVLTSQGDVTPHGLAPRAYEETRRGKRRAVRLEDDTVLLENGRVASRPDGLQDTASQFVELSHRFSSGRDPLQEGHAVTFWMARPNGVDLWTYDIVAREMLRTPGFGVIETYRLKPRRLTNPRGNITAEIWYAPSLQYLPVRIRLNTGETDYVDLLVEKIEQR